MVTTPASEKKRYAYLKPMTVSLFGKKVFASLPCNTPLRVGSWSSLLSHLSCPWTHCLPSRLGSRAALGAFQAPGRGQSCLLLQHFVPSMVFRAQARSRGLASSPTGWQCAKSQLGARISGRTKRGCRCPSPPAVGPGTSGVLCELGFPGQLNGEGPSVPWVLQKSLNHIYQKASVP